ncbi:hypothetical protein [Ilumatobacter sp.]|uniref:hypothetical protein n=1 Tax=Ilumatobacter sp. TaxID=1967498 RepID=UPI003AF9FB06
MPRVPFPTSYAACRDDFRASAEHAGAAATGTPITATGPDGLGLMTPLARHALDSPGDRWTRSTFPGTAVVNTVRAGCPPRRGKLAGGLADLVPTATFHAVKAEVGTRSDITMILAERSEHRVHLHCDRADHDHARIVEHHVRYSTPDDAAWPHTAIEHGRRVLDQALDAIGG